MADNVSDKLFVDDAKIYTVIDRETWFLVNCNTVLTQLSLGLFTGNLSFHLLSVL